MIPYAKKAHGFFRQPGDFDEEATLLLFNSFQDSRCWIVGDYRAALFGVLLPVPFTRDLMGHTLFWYHPPQYQAGAEFVSLAKHFVKWCDESSVVCTSFTHWSHLNPKLCGLVKKLGFNYSHSEYVRAV